MDLMLVSLATERLKLVAATAVYAEAVFREYRDPVTLYMNHPAPDDLEALRQRMERRERTMEAGEILSLAVLLRERDEFLGCFSLESLDERTPEMGGWLKRTAHGNRYGQEAAAAVRHWADGHLDYEHLLWPCVAENLPSRKVAESLGGRFGRAYEKTTASGRTWPYVEYWIPRGTVRG